MGIEKGNDRLLRQTLIILNTEVLLIQFENVYKMVLHTSLFFDRCLSTEDVNMAVDLHGIRRDHLSTKLKISR